jgi:DNA-binding protein H-NS
MRTYAAVKAEIAKLEAQAEALRAAEVADVVGRIREAIATYSLTAADLGLARSTVKKNRAPPKLSRSIGVPEYRDPKTGKTWTGRGKPPMWIAGVKNRDRYLIDAQAASNGTSVAAPQSSKRATASEGSARNAGARKSVGRKRAITPAKTPAVELESGVASS